MRVALFDPRHVAAVIEADCQVHAELDLAFKAHHQTHHAVVDRHGHEVDEHRPAGIGGEQGFQNQRTVAITAGDLAVCIPLRGNFPATVVAVAQQGSKAGRRVETRKTQPVQRPVAGHQRCGAAVAEQRVVFNRYSHRVIVPLNV